MNTDNSGELPKSPSEFEEAFGLLPLGDDDASWIDRLERIMGRYLAAAMGHERNFMTVRAERLPIPSRDAVEGILDEFTDPDTVQARD
jgi:hypothetical protein